MKLLPCPKCGTPRPADRGCGTCTWQHANQRPRRRRDLNGTWSRRSRAAREQHVDEHGPVCPGLGDHQPHRVAGIGDLALHELDGPGSEPHRCVVLCRTENSRIGAPS